MKWFLSSRNLWPKWILPFLFSYVICAACSQICKYDIEQSISREMSGDLEEGMLTVGTYMYPHPHSNAQSVLLAGYKVLSMLDMHVGSQQRMCIQRDCSSICVVKAVRDKPAYFAERLYKSMKVCTHPCMIRGVDSFQGLIIL